jgi:MotA/TolQ/ExbB proton channel family
MNIIDFHLIGGLPFMVILTFSLLAIFGCIVLSFIRSEDQQQKWHEAIKQLGGFALAWGAFSTLVGLYQAFEDLSTMQEMLPLNVIMGGLKVALITTLYGFGIFLFSQAFLLVRKATKKERES